MGSTPVTSRRQAEQLLANRASTDPAFRAQLLKNPREAISSAIGMALPAAVEVTVLEETDRRIYLVLPPLAAGEMAEEELASVAGGIRAEAEKANDAGKFSKTAALDPDQVVNPQQQFRGGP